MSKINTVDSIVRIKRLPEGGGDEISIPKIHLKKSFRQKLTSSFLIFVLLFQLMGGAFLFGPTQTANAIDSSWLSGYSHRVKVPVSATTVGAQTDYQMSIVLHSKTGTNTAGDIYLNSHLQDTITFNDIRFTASDGSVLKSFWIEKIEDETDGRKATVWVKLDTSATGTTDYYIYYGKTGDTNASDYDKTFTKDYGEEGLVGLWHMDEQTPGTELFTDGDLETWTDTTTLTNWTNDGAFAGVRDITQELTTRQAGDYALKLAATSNPSTNFGVYQDITVASNQNYQVNFYQLYATRAAGTLEIEAAGTLEIEAYDNTNSVSLGSQSIITQGTILSYTSFRFATAATTTSVKIKVYLNSETNGIAYIDSLSVKQSSKTLTDTAGSNTGTINGASRIDIDGGQWGNRSDAIFSTGSALQFDGKDDFVKIGNGEGLDNQDFTIEFWANNLGGGTESFGILGTTDFSSHSGLGLYSNNNRNVNLWIGTGLGTTNQIITSIFSVTSGFNHYAVTKSGQDMTAYKNGMVTKTASLTGDISYTGTLWELGKNFTKDHVFEGFLDDVRIYNRALVSSEISRQYIRSKYSFFPAVWEDPTAEEQFILEVTTQIVSPATINDTNVVLNGYLAGLGGTFSAEVYFKYGLTLESLSLDTDPQVMGSYGFFNQKIYGLTKDTTYYYQAVVDNGTDINISSISSFQTAAFDTNYCRVIINANGSLTFVNKDTGEVILNNSPTYNLNYGSVTNSVDNSINGSFETDLDSNGIPDGWSIYNDYIRISTEQVSDGTESLKSNMISTDTEDRRIFSPIVTISSDKKYTFSFDSYSSNVDTNFKVYLVYYDAEGETRVGIDDTIVYSPAESWRTHSLDWTPPASAKSFRFVIFFSKETIGTVYLDKLVVTEKVPDYTVNGNNINHTLMNNGDSFIVTSIDDSNPYAKVTHKYEMSSSSPNVNYEATLQYKQDVSVTEERFDFIVPAQSAQVVARDLQLIDFDTTQAYWSDADTPKVVKFSNGLFFGGNDTVDSMQLRVSESDSRLSFYSDYEENHPHYTYVIGAKGETVYNNQNKRAADEVSSVSIFFAINPNSPLKPLIKTRQPYGYDATLVFTNHADNETIEAVNAVSYGTEDIADPDYGTKGVVGRGLGWTKSVFVSGVNDPYADLEDEDYKSLTDKMYEDGVEIIAHTITTGTDSREAVQGGLRILSQYQAKNWIDHGGGNGNDNREVLALQGAVRDSNNYILDLLDQYNYKYAWSYIDLYTSGLNIVQPASTSEVRPFLFYNNQIDDDTSDSKKIYFWSTKNTSSTPEIHYTTTAVDSLIGERGIHVGHDYLGMPTRDNHTFYTNPSTGKVEIYPVFDAELAYIAQKKEDCYLWSPTVSKMGDYLISLRGVVVTNNKDDTYTVTNNSSASVTGITLLAENDINSVTIDGKSLVSFGGSVGSKELVLPTLNAGQSMTLVVNYGTKDSSLPTIISNDTGKNKVNEITGVWDSTAKSLTLTAEGNSALRSFTVKMPALADKKVLVRDIYSNTVIGSYQSSSDGEITFSAPLGSIHTFTITEITSGGVFTPPTKPNITNIDITVLDNGNLTFDNLPDSITQLAISLTPDFTNASWEDISKKEELFQRYAGADKLYIKFRTDQGAVSDVITCEGGNVSITEGTDTGDTNNQGSNTQPLNDGDIVKTSNSPDVYIIKYKNNKQYKRLILAPYVFNLYGHLKWENIKTIPQSQLDQFTISNLIKETLDSIIYQFFPDGDTGKRKPLDTSTPYDPDSTYEINKPEQDSYESIN